MRKVWNDDNDRDGNRPDFVTVRLYAGGTEIGTAELSAATNWEYTFVGLPRRVNGMAIAYSVSEDPVPWYVSSVNGHTITNTYQPERTVASVRKVWNDNGQEALRPKSVRAILYCNGKPVRGVLLSEENNWTAAVTDLPTRVNGQPAEYTWSETDALGYVQESVTRQGTQTVITNKPWERPRTGGAKPKRAPGDIFFIFEEYDTPLGVEIMINHVGDCFD